MSFFILYSSFALLLWSLYKYQTTGKTSSLKRKRRDRKRSPFFEWFSRPSRLAQWTLNQKRKQQLNLLEESSERFLRYQQTIISTLILHFWLFLWFGDFSFKNIVLLFILYPLLFSLPALHLQLRYQKHLVALAEEVPSFIDLLSLVLQSGQSLEQALSYLSKDSPGLIPRKVRKSLKLMDLGQPFISVLTSLQDSIDLPQWQHFWGNLLHAKRLGVSLSSTLEIQSEILRTRRRQRAEELSRTASVKITLPLVLFIFPALLIIYLGPGLLHLLNR